MAKATKLRTLINKHEKKLVGLTSDLIRFPTVNPPGEQYRQCAEYLKQYLSNLGMKAKVHRVPQKVCDALLPGGSKQPRYNVVARLDVGASKTLHFNAHYDVVPVSGDWTYPPFEPTVKDGWLFGRGSTDMKGNLACCILAVQSLIESGVEPKVNIEISCTADEETGGQLGAGYIVENNLINADYVIVCEGGFRNQIGVGHNGVLWLDVLLQGKSAHAARPHEGVNAFEQMAALVDHLQTAKTEIAQHRFTTPNGMSFQPTISVGGEFGTAAGAKINTVPGNAFFSIDRRLMPDETLAATEKDLRTRIRNAKQHIPKLNAKVQTRLGVQPCYVDHTTALPQQFQQAVKRIRGGRPDFSINTGFTDLHYFVNEGKLPGIGYGIRGKHIHGVDECVAIDEMLETTAIYAQFLTDFEG